MKNRGKFLLFLFFFIILSMLVTGQPQAKVIIKPIISSSWRVDNNFYKAEEREKVVSTYLLQPGIELGYETAKSLASLMYTLDAFYYKDEENLLPNEQAAENEEYMGYNGKLGIKTRPTARILIGFEGSYLRTRDAGNTDAFNNTVDRNKYDVNRLTPSMVYDFGEKFSAGVRYLQTNIDYDLGTIEDSVEKRPMFDLVYNLNKTTSFDLEYQHWKKDYNLTTSDYSSDQGKIILRKKFRRIALEVGGGYQTRDFDDPALEDIDLFTHHINISGTEELLVGRRIQVNYETNFNDQGSGGYYTAHKFTLQAGHDFSEKLNANINSSYQISDYDSFFGVTTAGTTEKRKDTTYDIAGNVFYKLTNWLNLSLSAGYAGRNSNLDGRDYINKYAMASLNLGYNLFGR